MSFPATHFYGLTLRFLSTPLIAGGNNLQNYTLHPDGGISLLCVGNILNKYELWEIAKMLMQITY
jgi:hypothetical protein